MSTQGTRVQDALSEPQQRVGRRFVASYSLAFLGLWMAFFAPIQVLLAQQMEQIAPLHKEAALGWVTGAGALVALLANPLCGAWSDRTTLHWGRRKPWSLFGMALGALALVLLGKQTTLVGVILWWCVAQFALNALLAALMAELPDQVPVAQRASCSAWTGITQPLGVVVGTLLVTACVVGISPGYAAVALALLVCVLPFLLLVGNTHLQPSQLAPWRWRAFLQGFWVPPQQHPDFLRAWCMRFLVQLGSALGTLYLLYFLRDAIGYERLFPGKTSEDGLIILVVVYTAGVVVGALLSGYWSDRSGRRKRNIVLGSAMMALAALLLGLWPDWTVAMLAATLLGLGYGIYVAVEQALMSQLLPAASARGKDLGVLNIANSAPQVLGPAVAAVLVTRLGGYPALYVVTALVTLFGGLLALRVRSVS
ncbi:MAG: MFS transporter [Thermomonas sp.]|uniref:MFS transporter n=1 Tax=Thermomonas sp. TaxID=1971895 RepID=UPI001ED4F1B7|nr:MFS transporter [Thermomonas sp.]MBV2209447.1 MFS transporter [Thermomonas sp.]